MLQNPRKKAPTAPLVTLLFPSTWEQDSHGAHSAPLSKPFGFMFLQGFGHSAPSRPCVSPLESTLSGKPYTNPPLSNSIRFSHFQTSCKAPLSKSFRIIAFQKKIIFLRRNQSSASDLLPPQILFVSAALHQNSFLDPRPPIRPSAITSLPKMRYHDLFRGPFHNEPVPQPGMEQRSR